MLSRCGSRPALDWPAMFLPLPGALEQFGRTSGMNMVAKKLDDRNSQSPEITATPFLARAYQCHA
jgi:hypothetical protein